MIGAFIGGTIFGAVTMFFALALVIVAGGKDE